MTIRSKYVCETCEDPDTGECERATRECKVCHEYLCDGCAEEHGLMCSQFDPLPEEGPPESSFKPCGTCGGDGLILVNGKFVQCPGCAGRGSPPAAAQR